MPRPSAALPPCSLLLLLLLRPPKPGFAAEYLLQLPAPQNVTIYSYNYQNLLRWAPVKVDSGSVLYTVQYTTKASDNWEEINCTNITKTECNFTHPSIKSYWTITLRVRAEIGQMKSDWVETNDFVANQDTIIGPPVIENVDSTSDSLLLSFLPPFKEDSFQEDNLLYNVFYWEKSTNKQHKSVQTRNTQTKLQNLKQMTEYCFQIQAELLGDLVFKSNIGLLSDIICNKTTVGDVAKTVIVVIVFVGAIVTVVILAITCYLLIKKFQKTIKYWFQPPFKIPPHIEEDLKDSEMPVLEELQNNYAEEDFWDSLSVVSSAEGSQALVRNTLNTNVHSDNRATESEKT